MATGSQHTVASGLAAPVVVAGVAVLSQSVLAGLLAGVGCLAGIALTPDLDQESVSASEWWIVRHTAGVGWLWLAFWWGYAALIPHRSWLSHAPLVGTIGRVAYCAVPVVAALWLLDVPVYQADVAWLWPVVAGLAVSDVLHWLMDI